MDDTLKEGNSDEMSEHKENAAAPSYEDQPDEEQNDNLPLSKTPTAEHKASTEELSKERMKLLSKVWTICVAVLITLLTIIFFIIVGSLSSDDEESDDYLDTISFPLSAGFKIEVYNDLSNSSGFVIEKPRALRSAYYDDATILYVGAAGWGATDRAYVLIDRDSDGVNDDEFVIFESSSVGSSYHPASLAYDANHTLYISLTDMLVECEGNVHEQVLAFESDQDRLSCSKIMDIPVTAEDASQSYNVRRYIGISPFSGELCMANGMTCNDCAADGADISFPHGTITCFVDKSASAMAATNMSNEEDPNIVVKADGVRNSVGFDWNPLNDAFYFTDNGRDEVHPDDSYPDDELNFVPNSDLNHFGFPLCHSLGSGLSP